MRGALTALGVPVPPAEKEVADQHLPVALRLADDVTEDAFTVACVASWWHFGKFVGKDYVSVVVRAAAGPLLPPRVVERLSWALRVTLTYSVPAGKYYKCKEHGDALGDAVQARMGAQPPPPDGPARPQ